MSKPHKYLKYKPYLNSLRDTEKVNMMSAGVYLIEDFDEVTHQKAREIILWYAEGAKETEE